MAAKLAPVCHEALGETVNKFRNLFKSWRVRAIAWAC
jgi:hypothetical protein